MLELLILLSQLVVFGIQLELATVPNANQFFSDSLFFEIMEPDVLSYTYKIRPARDFGGLFEEKYQGIDLVLAQPLEGCSSLASNVRGSVVLVMRGGCSFLTKTLNAEKAGAVAAIISDNDEENNEKFIDMIDDSTNRKVSIPSLFLMGKDGSMIKRVLTQLEMPSAVINIPVNVTGIPIRNVNQPPWTLW